MTVKLKLIIHSSILTICVTYNFLSISAKCQNIFIVTISFFSHLSIFYRLWRTSKIPLIYFFAEPIEYQQQTHFL